MELLETILLNLRPRDVLVMQRVSKTWQATTEGSLKLQRALCYVPSSDRLLDVGADNGRSATPTGNKQDSSNDRRMLCSARSLNRRRTSNHSANHFIAEAARRQACVLNPFFSTLLKRTHPSGQKVVTHSLVERLASAIDPPWARMFLTQPPTARLVLQKSFQYINYRRANGSVLRLTPRQNDIPTIITNDGGITIGHLVRELKEDGETSRERGEILGGIYEDGSEVSEAMEDRGLRIALLTISPSQTSPVRG